MASGRCDAAHRLRSFMVVSLRDGDKACLFQHLQMPAQVAVGKAAQLLEVAEYEPLRVRHERGQDAQARFLVDDTIEPIIGEAPGFVLASASFRHRSSLCSN